jgi:chromosome segregation ATPase
MTQNQTQAQQPTRRSVLTQIEATYAAPETDLRTLRRQAETLDENIHDMTQTLFRFVDRFGWEFVKVEELDAEITQWTALLGRISERIRALQAAQTAAQEALRETA